MNGLITFAAAVVLAATASAENAPGSCEVQVGDWAIGGTCSVRRHGGGDWRLGAEALPSGTDGVAFVRVRLEADQPAKKPMFSVIETRFIFLQL